MDVCMYGRCQSAYTSRPTDAGNHRIQMTYCPIVNRRPTTSYLNRQAFTPSPRIHSAVSRVAMATPRAPLSTAGFYDWSADDVDDIPMSSVYQKIAVTNSNKYNSKTNRPWCADGIHVNPGRMFVRDKAQLTKGEREIIAGIYKNRGDIHNKNGVNAHVKSHKDAWLVGKHSSKKSSSLIECEKCLINVPEHLFCRVDTQRNTTGSPDELLLCASCRTTDCVPIVEPLSERSNIERKGNGTKAPPSSPTASEIAARKQIRLPKTKAGEGAIVIESGKTFYDPQEGKKKKVFVDVFLPKFPTPQLTEEPTNVSLREENDKNKPYVSNNVENELGKRPDSASSSQGKTGRVRQKLFHSQTPRASQNRDSSSGE